MKSTDVESICQYLPALLKKSIRKTLLKYEKPPELYSSGEALLLWAADWLTGTNIIKQDQLWTLLEEFSARIIEFGTVHLDKALITNQSIKNKSLPVCKLGFLDRNLACIDGCDKFINLTTGNVVSITNNWPIETIGFNLTALYLQYEAKLKRFCSAEHNLKEQENGERCITKSTLCN